MPYDINNLLNVKMTESKRKSSFARLEARVDPAAKALWQQAAELEGRTLTDFVIASLQESAAKVLQRHKLIELNREDSEAFVEAVLNPAQANDALVEAFQE